MPKLTAEGLRLAAEATPAPLKVTTWGVPGALSEMDIEAVRLPTAVGANVTFIAQVPPAATELLQVLVCA